MRGYESGTISETEKGKVIYFAVQLEVEVQGQWKVVVRYDCSHGFTHRDTYDQHGHQTKRMLPLRFESALTYGDWDITTHWRRYTQEFRRWVSDE